MPTSFDPIRPVDPAAGAAPRSLCRLAPVIALVVACMVLLSAHAAGGDGKLLLTGGVSSIDGLAGGGLTPWAVTAGYATEGEHGGAAFATRVQTADYALTAFGAAWGAGERFELAVARQDLVAGATGTALGLPGLHLRQDIVGGKLRLFGDAVLDADTLVPAVAVGLQAKWLHAGGLSPTLDALGARRRGLDAYASATKLFLGAGVLVNATLRATRANQNGLLGFGGTGRRRVSFEPEISVAKLLRRDLAVGAEYRAMPDKLNPSALGDGLRADDWKDVFVAWAPSKRVSLTAAFVDLGRVVPAVQPRRQRGGYLSLQFAP